MSSRRRGSLRDAFGEGTPQRSEPSTSKPVNTVREDSITDRGPITETGEVEMVPGGKGEMVPADKSVNMTFTVTAKERYLWTLELKRRGRTAVSVLRDAMDELEEQES